MKPPIIINENGSLNFFRSVAEAERYLEPIDVRNHEYVAYDSDGRRLELGVEQETVAGSLGIGKTIRERVCVVQAEETATHAEELKNILRASIEKLGAPHGSLHSATLRDLIKSSTDRIGFA